MVQNENLIKSSLSKTAQARKSNLEKELYASIYKFLILSETFVCAPIGIHLPKAKLYVKTLRNLSILHIFWFLLIYLLLSVSIYFQHTTTNANLPNIQKPLFFCEYLVYLMHVLQIVCASYYGRSRFHCLLNAIIEYDCRLLDYDVVPMYSRYTRFCNSHLILLVLHFLSTITIDYFYNAGIFWSYMRSTTVCILPNTIIHMSLTQYYGLLHAIYIRLLDIKHILRTSKFSIPFQYSYDMLHDLRLLCLQLELLTKKVNDSFGPSIVLVYIGSYFNLSVNVFILYGLLENWKTTDWTLIMYAIIWICMHIGKMFLILYYNYRIQAEKNNITFILNDQKSHRMEMEETIMHFIFQLKINTRSNIVCGVAELNLDFIKSLLVAISTLFIFLLQYDITFEALTKTHTSGGSKIL